MGKIIFRDCISRKCLIEPSRRNVPNRDFERLSRRCIASTVVFENLIRKEIEKIFLLNCDRLLIEIQANSECF